MVAITTLTAILINNHSSTRDLGNIAKKFESFGWHTQVINGRDEDSIESALTACSADHPSLVIAEVLNDV